MVRYADARYIRWMRYILFTQNAIKCHNNREILPSFEGRWREKSRFFVTEGSLLRSNIFTKGETFIKIASQMQPFDKVAPWTQFSQNFCLTAKRRSRVENHPPLRWTNYLFVKFFVAQKVKLC